MIFDLRTEKGFLAAETYKENIENKGKTPIIKGVGFDKVRIIETK